MSAKQKIVHSRGISNQNLGVFVCSFDVCRASKPVPSINYALSPNLVPRSSTVIRKEDLVHSRSQSCDPLGQCLGSRALAGSNLTVRDSRTSDRSAQSRIFFKTADQAKSLTRGVESWNGNSRFKRHHIERK